MVGIFCLRMSLHCDRGSLTSGCIDLMFCLILFTIQSRIIHRLPQIKEKNITQTLIPAVSFLSFVYFTLFSNPQHGRPHSALLSVLTILFCSLLCVYSPFLFTSQLCLLLALILPLTLFVSLSAMTKTPPSIKTPVGLFSYSLWNSAFETLTSLWGVGGGECTFALGTNRET